MIRCILPLAALVCLFLAAPSNAQTNPYTWNTTTGSWNTAANWLDGTAAPFVPPSDAATELVFNASGTTSYTATNDIGSDTFTLNRLTVNNTGTGLITITGATTANTLTFAGTNPTLDIQAGSVQFLGLMVGSGTITKTGNGTFIHDSNNSGFTGTLVIDGGTFINRATTTAVTNFNPVSIVVNNGGTYQFGAATVGDPNLPNTTYITVNVGGLVNWQEGEQMGGFHLNGGSINLQQGSPTPNGTTVQNWSSGTLTGGSFVIGGVKAINKTTVGTVTIQGSASITTSGALNIQEGTIAHVNAANLGTSNIVLGAASTAGMFEYQGASATRAGTFATNDGGGTISVTNAATTLTLSGAFSGTGTLSKSGAGALHITGTLGITATTTVAGGTLRVNPLTAAGGFVVMDGATLAINSGAGAASFTTPTLSLSSTAATVSFELNAVGVPTTPLIVVSNADGLTGSGATVRLTNTQPLASGTYTLIDYTGAAITSGYNVSLLGRSTGTVVYNTANTSIDLNVTAESVKWGGQISNVWDVGTSPGVGGTFNWRLGSSGSTTNFVNSDAIVFDDSANSFSVDLGTAVSPSSVAVNNSTNAYTISGAGKITGSAGLVKSGTGMLTLLTNNDYTGPTILSAGSIQIGNGGTTGSITSTISGTGGTVIFNRSDNITYAGSLTGAVGITKNSTNVLTLTGTNTQTGAVTINAGVISIATQNNLGGNTPVTFNGGTLRITGTYTTGDTIQVFTFGGDGGTIDVTGTATKQGNSITGPGNLNKTGAGLLSIGSAGGTGFTGTLNVLAGTLRFQSQRLSNANGINVSAGAAHEINDDAVAGTFFVATGTSVVLNGAGPSGSATPGAFILTDQGGGTTGPTTTYRNAIVLATNSTIGTHNGGGTRVSTLIFENSITGPGNLTKVGAGVVVLTAAGSTYGGANGTTAIQNGAIQIRNGDNRLPTATSLILGSGTTSGQFDLNSQSQTIAGLTTAGTGTQNAVVNTGATVSTLTVDYNGASPQSYAGFLGGGALGFNGFNLVKSGTGTFILATAATYTGNTTITDGTLRIGGNNHLPATMLTFGGGSTSGTFDLNGFSQMAGGLASAGSGTANQIVNTGATSGTFTVDYSGVAPLTFNGRLGGGASGNNFSLVKSGSGTVSITGPLTLTGAITISGGTLKVASSATSSGFSVADNSALSVLVPATPSSLSMPTLALGPAGSTINFEFNSTTQPTVPLINVTGADGFTPGAGAHTINLLSSGLLPAGTFTLIDYVGAGITSGFTINPATLPARTVANLNFNVANTSIDVAVSTDSIKWNGNVSANWDVGTSAGAGGTFNWKLSSNSASTNFIATDVVTFDDSAAGNFNVNLSGANPIQPTSVTVNNTLNSYTFSTTTGGAVSGSAFLTKLGTNSLIVLTNNTNTGVTTVTAGTLQIGNGGTTGAIGTGNLVNNSAVVFNRSDDVTFGGNISGTGSLTKNGSNNLTLTGAFTMGGNTTLDGGLLTLNASTPYTYGGAIGGAGGLTKDGLETVILTGTSNYGGATTIANGVLQLGNGGTTGSITSNVSVGTGALFSFNRSNVFNFAGTVTGLGGVNQIGGGETTIAGDASFTGPITVSAGKLNLSRLTTITQTGATSVTAGTLEVTVGSPTILTIAGTTTIAAGGSMKTNVASGASLLVQTLGGQMTINGNYEINAALGSTVSYNSIISGNGNIVKSGDGQANLYNANTFNGSVTINGGILRVEDGGLGGDFNAVSIVVNSGGKFEFFGPTGNPDLPNTTFFTINTGGVVEFSENENFGGVRLFGGTLTLKDMPDSTLATLQGVESEFRSGTINIIGTGGIIDGSTAIRKTTAGTVTITGVPLNNNGGLFIDAGTINTDSGIGDTGVLTFGTNGAGATSGTLIYSGITATSNKDTTLNEGGGTFNISLASTTLNFGGAITGTGIATKTGPGTLNLSGSSNGYTGGTIINGGALAVNNASGSATGSGSVTVNNDGTLRGGNAAGTTGFVGGPVTVNAGGKIRGNGILTVNNNLTLTLNGILETEATRTTANVAAASLIKLTGAGSILNLNPGAGGKFTINLVNDTINPLVAGESYTITLAQVETAGNIQLNGSSLGANAPINASNYVVTTQNFPALGATTLFIDSTGTMLQLSVAAVPEPEHIMMLSAGMLGLIALIWRRVRRPSAAIA